ncbi:unnamed protein product [Neospora caninum Liverpool]|uniref:AP2/ERF domain-containing protein n=1 Tax=Neospora caninum (strain Liverpool) TaxID=572307 RepID=F0VFV0_NEOCL|nr:uncharacterized protein NCLIV_023830 [Neospora caninum Liverpool]CBZ52594.1 unnamed protein product [Neospora caninum Liverpool]|eukprot:XP_003882626.1 uncharacterized protein NCLIV_023830 [Neospora caninum Liverpool]
MRLQRVDEHSDRLADNIADAYSKLCGLAADLDDLANALKQDVTESVTCDSRGEFSSSKEVHRRGQALSVDCGKHANPEHENEARSVVPAKRLSEESEDPPPGLAAVSSSLLASAEPNGPLVEDDATPDSARDVCTAGHGGVSRQEEVWWDNTSASVGRERHRQGDRGCDEAPSSTRDAFHALLSAPIIPRAARRPRWWRGEIQSEHHFESCLRRNEGYDAKPSTRLDSPAGCNREEKTDDEGVRFGDGRECDPYCMHSEDFFSLTDVISPFIRGSASRSVHEHTRASDLPSSASVPMTHHAALMQRPTSEDSQAAKSSSAIDGDAERGHTKEEAVRLETDEGEHLCSLLNGGGGITRWCSFASRKVGDFKPFLRREGPSLVSPRECQASLPVGGMHVADGRQPARILPFSVPDEAPWVAAVNTSYAAGIPSLMLPQIVRGRSDPTRHRPAELHGASRATSLGPSRGAGFPCQRDETVCAGIDSQPDLQHEDGRGGQLADALHGRDPFDQAWVPHSCSEEKNRHAGQNPDGHNSLAGGPAAELETKASALKGRGSPVGSTTMGATMAFPHVKGVTYNRMKKYWIAQWIENGQSKVKYFSTFKYGDEAAHDLAVEWRMKHAGRGSSTDDRFSQRSNEIGRTVDARGLAHDGSEPRSCAVREGRNPGAAGTLGQGIVGVSFSRTGNAWLAYIKNRVTKTQLNRYFKVNVYGFRLAKKKAIEARLELEERMRNSNQSGWDAFSDRKSLAVGVYYEDKNDSWVACCRDPRTGEGIYKFFPVSECPGGDLEARAKAIDARMDMDDVLGADDEQSLTQLTGEVARRKRKRKMEDEGRVLHDETGVAELLSKENYEGTRDNAGGSETDVGTQAICPTERERSATKSSGTTHVGGEQRTAADESDDTRLTGVILGAGDHVDPCRDFVRIERSCAGGNGGTEFRHVHESGAHETIDPVNAAADGNSCLSGDVEVSPKENHQEEELLDEEGDDGDSLTQIHAVEEPSSGRQADKTRQRPTQHARGLPTANLRATSLDPSP